MRTLIIGASPNPERYSNKAVRMLMNYGHEVFPLGIRKGEINGISIILDRPFIPDIHTISLYVGPANQNGYYDFIISLKPKRIIFNPGTENAELIKIAEQNNIIAVQRCTLVMLHKGIF